MPFGARDGRETRTLGGAGFPPMDPARPLRSSSRVIFCNILVRQIYAPCPTFSSFFDVDCDLDEMERKS